MATLMGIPLKHYRYYDEKNICVDFKALCEDFRNATPGSIMLL